MIDEGLGCDLLLLSGGVSMGKYDLVEQVLTGLQAEFYFTGVAIQPGKPAVFGSCGAGALARLLAAHEKPTGTGMPEPQKKFFFGLPGNPVSTMVTFELFAKPMIEALAGQAPQPLIFPAAKLKSEIRTKTGLKRFLPAVLSGEFENAEVELAPWQGSGDIAALAQGELLRGHPSRPRTHRSRRVGVIADALNYRSLREDCVKDAIAAAIR